MKFSLKTVNLKNVKSWDRPACYRLNISVSIPTVNYLHILGYWPSIRSRWLDIMANHFVGLWAGINRDVVKVHEDEKKGQGQFPAILTEQAWLIKDLL